MGSAEGIELLNRRQEQACVGHMNLLQKCRRVSRRSAFRDVRPRSWKLTITSAKKSTCKKKVATLECIHFQKASALRRKSARNDLIPGAVRREATRVYGIKPVDTANHLYNDNVMEQSGYTNTQPDLDAIFAALADPTRRAILSRLADGQASVNEIAAPFEMSQPAVSRHLKVLERAGLIEREIDEQRRPAKLKAQKMTAAVDWLTQFEAFWDTSFKQLDDVLNQMKQSDK